MLPILHDLPPAGFLNCSGMFSLGTSISDKMALSSPVNRAFATVFPHQLLLISPSNFYCGCCFSKSNCSTSLMMEQDTCTAYFLSRLRLYYFSLYTWQYLYFKVDSTRLLPCMVRHHMVSIWNTLKTTFHQGTASNPEDSPHSTACAAICIGPA